MKSRSQRLRVRWVKREENVADLGTKALSKAVISKHCITLGVCQYDERVEVPSKTCTLTMPSRQASRRSSFLRTHTSTVGIARHLQEEENVILARGVGGNICACLWPSDRPGALCSEFKDDSEILGQPADLEHVIRQSKGNTNCRGLEHMAHVG